MTVAKRAPSYSVVNVRTGGSEVYYVAIYAVLPRSMHGGNGYIIYLLDVKYQYSIGSACGRYVREVDR